jgi:hypothetical protein
LDGVDCPVRESRPLNRHLYSQKFNRAGLKYEIGLNVNTGDIVWAYGGYGCGMPDLVLAREAYIEFIDEGELTIADDGYRDRRYFIYPAICPPNMSAIHKAVMSRHETVNGRLKNFNVMKSMFRHDKSKHSQCFHAVINIIELSIEYGDKLYQL